MPLKIAHDALVSAITELLMCGLFLKSAQKKGRLGTEMGPLFCDLKGEKDCFWWNSALWQRGSTGLPWPFLSVFAAQIG